MSSVKCVVLVSSVVTNILTLKWTNRKKNFNRHPAGICHGNHVCQRGIIAVPIKLT